MAAPRRGASAESAARAVSAMLSGVVRALRELENRKRAAPPTTAMASTPAVRETALLMPDAVPAKCVATELMTAVLSGATVMPMPTPRRTTPGKNVTQ